MITIENLKSNFEKEYGVKPRKIIFNKDAVALVCKAFGRETPDNLKGKRICELTIVIDENAEETFTICNEKVAPKVEEVLRLPRL